jgi:hypothetical protein
MPRYLAKACPRCDGYVGITIREPGRNVRLQAVNGRCTQCSYRMAWFMIRGRRAESRSSALKTEARQNQNPTRT